jgi:hypothetical protein
MDILELIDELEKNVQEFGFEKGIGPTSQNDAIFYLEFLHSLTYQKIEFLKLEDEATPGLLTDPMKTLLLPLMYERPTFVDNIL